jgi:hypothetical protein
VAASARSGCRAGKVQLCRSSNQVTVRRRAVAPPPGGQSRQPQSSAIFSLITAGPQLRHTPAAGVGDLDPDHAAGGPDRDRLPFSARAAAPDAVGEQLTSRAASSPHGCPGPGHPGRERAGRPGPLRPPSRSPAPPVAASAPAFPGPPRGPGSHPDPRPGTRGCTLGSAARVKPEIRRRRGPSVAVRGKPTVIPTAQPARTPSAIRPWTPRHIDPQ